MEQLLDQRRVRLGLRTQSVLNQSTIIMSNMFLLVTVSCGVRIALRLLLSTKSTTTTTTTTTIIIMIITGLGLSGFRES